MFIYIIYINILKKNIIIQKHNIVFFHLSCVKLDTEHTYIQKKSFIL